MIIDGKLVSKKIKEEIKEEIKKLPNKPKIVDILIGDNSASKVYIKSKEKSALEVGMDFECIQISSDTEESKIIEIIKKLNNDCFVNSILIQSPIPNNYDYKKLVNCILPNKDVDGLTDTNIGKLVNKKPSTIPCTPLGIIKLLEYYSIPVKNKNIVIVGRSNLVGIPLFHLLLNMDATVTICHSETKKISNFTKQADILIVAVGKEKFIKSDMIKKDSVIIDVGINKINDNVYGDVDFDNIVDKVDFITPVPGGVGPMTVCMLLYNTLNNYKEQNNIK